MSRQAQRLAVGILAHVDAGKTTLAESILYTTGAIRRLGRVDHGDAFLDNYELEKARGITIFSKQAQVELPLPGKGGSRPITLLDTPGHVDFSAETERTLQILDAAVLVIGGMDGIQGHVRTLWKLLERYGVPVFLFVNKMDQPGADREVLMARLKGELEENCVDFSRYLAGEKAQEELAMCSEELMEQYLERGAVEAASLREAVRGRRLFPCFFGSALKLTGVEEFLEGLGGLLWEKTYPEEFGARVYKIARDESGTRLTYLKVTGGALRVKMQIGEHKADQIRIYSGAGYRLADEAGAGCVCAVTGLEDTFSGQGLGWEGEGRDPVLAPVMSYQVLLPQGCDVHRMLRDLRRLEEEIPELHILWREGREGEPGEIHATVMGEVQVEILRSLIRERFGVEADFGRGSILYRETILEPVVGIGHFEPLRHYAEVHLLLEPGEPGSGLIFDSACSLDDLDRNWQRLILTHLEEKRHLGVLTGSEITDMKITLAAGRAHLKHTEGGDFRQATYRAVRQGLKKARCRLLEPVYEFALEVPAENLGRAMQDVQRMSGSFRPPQTGGEMCLLTGSVPVSEFGGYQREVNAYTRGRGKLSCRLRGYEPCHNEAEVIAAIGYDSEADLENPAGSVFCAHGAGFPVSWDQVDRYAHIGRDRYQALLPPSLAGGQQEQQGKTAPGTAPGSRERGISQEEIDEIFRQSYRMAPRDKNPWNRPEKRPASPPPREPEYRPQKSAPQEEYLLVDGYNIIYAWEELRELSLSNVEGARTRLMDLLCDYQGCTGRTVIVVFDAYKVKGNPGSVQTYHNIHVVYTREAETADQYIEKTVHRIGRKYRVTVATSDALEQLIIWGQGAVRLSARELYREMEQKRDEYRERYRDQGPGERYFPFQDLESWS